MKAKYIIYSLLDFGLTFGGTAGVVIFNYITPSNSLGFKISFSGILLLIALVLTAKAIFEKSYRQKYDTMLQQLAEATDADSKSAISQAIEKHKTTNYIYQRLTMLLPFAILYIVTWLGATTLSSLQGSVGFILLSMGAGSIFNIIKRPIGDQISLDKITKRG